MVGLLTEALAAAGVSAETLRVLDLGAGNGIMAEELRAVGAEHAVGVDILSEARDAAERDRPGLYADYLVADLTALDDAAAAEEIRRGRDFLRTTFGVADTPFFRPPYGSHDDRIDRIAADLGHPTVVLWNGTLGDSRVISGAQLMAAARQWFTAQRIVVGHANHPAVTTVYGELLALLAERGLRTVTLADVWATPVQRLRGRVAAASLPR